MATFPAKISWEKPRKRENKKNRSDEFVPDLQLKIPKKKSKKIQKIKKHQYRFFSSQNKLGKAEKEGKENSFRRVPTRPAIGNSVKIAKIFKKLEYTIMATFRAKICWGRPRMGENKKHRSDEFLPDP